MRDDTGAPTRLLSPRDLHRAAQDDRPALRQTANRLRHAVKSEAANLTAGTVFLQIGGVVVVVFSIILVPLVFQLAAPGLLGGPLSGLGVFLLSLIGSIVLVSTANRRIILAMACRNLAYTAVGEGVCGSCAFSLEGAAIETLPVPRCGRCHAVVPKPGVCASCRALVQQPKVSQDPCACCGECGSRWLVERITRPHWERPVVTPLRKRWFGRLVPGLRPIQSLLTPDDRGGFVHTPDPRLLRVPKETWDRLNKRRRQLAKATRHAGWGWRVGLAAPWLALAGFFGWLLIIEIRTPGPDETVMIVTFGFACLLMIIPTVITLFSALGRPPKTTARRLVNQGLCGSCLHDLSECSPEPDQRTLCPTCGAAWLLPTQPNSPQPPPAAALPSLDDQPDQPQHPDPAV